MLNKKDLITANYLAQEWLRQDRTPVFAKLVDEVKQFQKKVEHDIKISKGFEVER